MYEYCVCRINNNNKKEYAMPIITITGEIDERGVPAGSTGYYKITNTGAQAVTGVFKLFWEERP